MMTAMTNRTSLTMPKISRLADGASLAIFLGIILLRPLISETYDSGGNSMTQALERISDPSPLLTLIFNWLIVLVALTCFTNRALGLVAYRRTGLECGTFVLMVAAVVSCYFAGQKRLAINASIDWLGYPLLTITLVQLLRDEWSRRLVIAVVLAAAFAQAAQCLEQAAIGQEETWQHYLTMKEEFWRQQSVELDAPTVELFERRIQAREAQGYLPHSNVAGAYLTMCLFVALGLGATGGLPASRFTGRVAWPSAGSGSDHSAAMHAANPRNDSATFFLLIARVIAVFAVAAAIYCTGSLGAILSGIAGLVLWMLLRVTAVWRQRNPRRAFALGWVLAFAGIAGFFAYGYYRGEFPHMSLTFRWNYWRATMPMIADYFWTGVGRGNFGRHYLFYKPIDAPEEISNPHNLFVQAFAEWGVLGLLALLLLVVGAAAMLNRSVSPPAEKKAASIGPSVFYAIFMSLVILAVRPFLLGATDPNYLYYATTTAFIPAALGFALFFPKRNAWGAGPALNLALPVALFTMLLHDQISFALFVPAAATTFFALLGCALAARETPVAFANRPQVGSVIACCVSLVILMATYRYGMKPVLAAAAAWERNDAQQRLESWKPGEFEGTRSSYDGSPGADPFDPTTDTLRGRQLLRAAAEATSLIDAEQYHAYAIDHIRKAIDKDPFQPSLYRLLARAQLEDPEGLGRGGPARSAVESARKALALYPRDPNGLIFLAELEEKTAAFDPTYRQGAAEHYQQALDLDAARPDWERIRRFNERKKAEIRARIAELQWLMDLGE